MEQHNYKKIDRDFANLQRTNDMTFDIRNQLGTLLSPLNTSIQDYAEFEAGFIAPRVNDDGEYFVECITCTNEAMLDKDHCEHCAEDIMAEDDIDVLMDSIHGSDL